MPSSFAAGLDNEDEEMEEIAQINIEPEILSRIQEERGSTHSERAERRSRRTIGRRNPSSRNGERRRRQHGNSNAIREAASLGAALGRATRNISRLPGNRRRTRRTDRENLNQPAAYPEESNEMESTNMPQMPESSSSSGFLPNSNQENGQVDEQSNSSWEDVSEEEVDSADNSCLPNDNSVEGNENGTKNN